MRWLSRMGAVTLFRIRCTGYDHVPAGGPVLVCANHQSYLDPVFIGIWFRRPSNYMARSTLFRVGPFGWLLGFLDAIPVDRDGLGRCPG